MGGFSVTEQRGDEGVTADGMPTESEIWTVSMAGDTRFNWKYTAESERLVALYEKGKERQWNASTRIDWSLEVDRGNPFGQPPSVIPIYGSRTWEALKNDKRAVAELYQHVASWQFSQFLHGEQGAMICSARIVESVPGSAAKLYAATQTIDEARHAELYTRYLREKIGMIYPIEPCLRALLRDTLADSRWDIPYLGMQVLIEGLGLAAFGMMRDTTKESSRLTHQILAYVMQDEARHVAFGRLVLKDYYSQLTSKELADRADFVVEACHLMHERFRAQLVWEALGFDMADCLEAVDSSPAMGLFRKLLFSRIVPCIRDIGLWTDEVQRCYQQIGVLDLLDADLDELMRRDEAVAMDLLGEQAPITG
jgi:hypothetical protein